MFKVTTALRKIRRLDKFIRGVQGGTSSGKTYGILPIEIDIAIRRVVLTSIVAESYPHLRRGAMRDFKRIMLDTGRWRDGQWRATDSTYTFTNGSQIEFFSADDESRLRGARRDRLFINEANNVGFNAYNQLASRTKECVTMDWNPVNRFWFHEELQGDDDVDFIILTYKDNEACPQAAIDYILKSKLKGGTSSFWANWHRVYGLGLIGNLEGVVFDEWDKIDKIPDEARLVGGGLDFGYTNDPTSLVYMYRIGDDVIYDECIYMKGLSNGDIANMIKGLRPTMIYADSAEPKSIDEIRRYGVSIQPVIKGRDSINYGIGLMQEHRILVTNRSINLIKELRNYTWSVDKAGAKINKPIDAFNHAIDAARYASTMILRNRKKHIRCIV